MAHLTLLQWAAASLYVLLESDSCTNPFPYSTTLSRDTPLILRPSQAHLPILQHLHTSHLPTQHPCPPPSAETTTLPSTQITHSKLPPISTMTRHREKGTWEPMASGFLGRRGRGVRRRKDIKESGRRLLGRPGGRCGKIRRCSSGILVRPFFTIILLSYETNLPRNSLVPIVRGRLVQRCKRQHTQRRVRKVPILHQV